jgi:hypothetical protein
MSIDKHGFGYFDGVMTRFPINAQQVTRKIHFAIAHYEDDTYS